MTLRFNLLFFLLFISCASAQTPAGYLKSEKEIHHHDNQLTTVAESLESWLAGRLNQAEFLKLLNTSKKQCAEYRTLPPEVSQILRSQEATLLDKISSFASQKAPDSDGQRRLFLELSRLTESRTTHLIEWRQKALRKILAGQLSREQHNYFRWELAWLEVWGREAELTHRLEEAFLAEGQSDGEPQQIVKSFLSLRLLADNIACPANLESLDSTATERLTLLTRTAEQLLRLAKRRGSGALTKVRRLSRQLAEITSRFQSERLARLEAIAR
jgi:hypothetical protein